MSQQNFRTALTIAPMLILVILLILMNPLIQPVSCGLQKSFLNSSLKLETIYRYSRAAAVSHPNHQTRACAPSGDPCLSTKDCCQTGGNELACAKFSTPSLKCLQCISNGGSCTNGDSECCTGSICSGGTCVSSNTCIKEDEPCWPGNRQCCDDYNCIIDAEGKSYCSYDCSTKNGQCSTSGSSSTCCPGNFCFDKSAGPTCDCGQLGESCEPGADSKTCCGQNQCDSSTSTCANCIAPRNYCTQAGETRSCFASLPCDSSGKCCLAKDATCDPNGPENTCCDGLLCIGDSCQPCIEAGSTCTPYTISCCGENYCSPDSEICCTPEDEPCDPDHSTCCDDLKCLTLGGSSTCKPACLAIPFSCNVAGDSRKCCEGTTCDVSGSYCCWGLNQSCLESPTHNYCCTGLKCNYTLSSSCIPACVGTGESCTPGVDTCCDDNECIKTGGSFSCKPKCVNGGQICKSNKERGWGWGAAGNNPCCSPLTCDSINHKCCAAVGITCGVSAPCCRGLTCNTATNVCDQKPCIPRGGFCDDDNFCCAGLACDPSSKVCLGGTGTSCNDANKCSSDHDCLVVNPDTSSCYPKWCL